MSGLPVVVTGQTHYRGKGFTLDAESWDSYYEFLDGVLESLRRYLGEAGYYWLSACAVFPELHWNLTVYLGNTLQTDDGRSLLQTCRLTDLARLPWFRYGYMPDWLRSWLIYELPRQQEDEVRKLLRSFLVAKPDERGSVGRWQLKIARQHSNVVSRLAQPLLRLLSREAPADSPLRDYIFQEFIAGRKRLAVRMPEELRKHLRRKYSQKLGWGLWLQWVLVNIFGGALGLPLSNMVYDSIEAQVGGTLAQAISGATIGTALGLAQWLIIRRRISRSSSWVMVTTVSWAMALAAYEAMGGSLNRILGGATMGAVLGLAQWLVLRRRVSRSSSWILATTVGLAMGWPLGLAIYEAVGGAMYESVSGAISGAMISLVYGVVTGTALLWLLQNRKQPLA